MVAHLSLYRAFDTKAEKLVAKQQSKSGTPAGKGSFVFHDPIYTGETSLN